LTHILVLLVMGVSGSGKSTVAEALAHKLGWAYVDADTFHSEANRFKMKQGIPLTDADRAPWLGTLQQQIDTWLANGQQAVLACSALKEAYREHLRIDDPRVQTIYLKADEALLRDRLQNRKNHFLAPALLESQLQTLEEPPPSQALYIDAALPLEQIVASICSHFGLLEAPF
jgi:gluconokinase